MVSVLMASLYIFSSSILCNLKAVAVCCSIFSCYEAVT